MVIIPVLTCFLPLYDTHLYLPFLFKVWEGLNSNVIDDSMLEFSGVLSEELISGDRCAETRDIGVWAESEWTLMIKKSFGSLS
jgi:proteasome activator subunit 4